MYKSNSAINQICVKLYIAIYTIKINVYIIFCLNMHCILNNTVLHITTVYWVYTWFLSEYKHFYKIYEIIH